MTPASAMVGVAHLVETSALLDRVFGLDRRLGGPSCSDTRPQSQINYHTEMMMMHTWSAWIASIASIARL